MGSKKLKGTNLLKIACSTKNTTIEAAHGIRKCGPGMQQYALYVVLLQLQSELVNCFKMALPFQFSICYIV